MGGDDQFFVQRHPQFVALLIRAQRSLGTLALFRWELDHVSSLAYAQTVALTTLVLYQTFQAGNARSEHRSLLRIPILSNRFPVLVALGALLLHTAALYLPPMQYVLGVEPLSIGSWAHIVAVALSLLVVVELHMLLRRPRGRAGQAARMFKS